MDKENRKNQSLALLENQSGAAMLIIVSLLAVGSSLVALAFSSQSQTRLKRIASQSAPATFTHPLEDKLKLLLSDRKFCSMNIEGVPAPAIEGEGSEQIFEIYYPYTGEIPAGTETAPKGPPLAVIGETVEGVLVEDAKIGNLREIPSAVNEDGSDKWHWREFWVADYTVTGKDIESNSPVNIKIPMYIWKYYYTRTVLHGCMATRLDANETTIEDRICATRRWWDSRVNLTRQVRFRPNVFMCYSLPVR